MTIVNVVDAPCGYGKTSWAIQYMNSMSKESHQFIFVTPFLGEVARIKSAVINREFKEPTVENGGSKIDDLHNLISQGEDICTTHALFQSFGNKTIGLLKLHNYTLILDEVTQVIEQVPTKKDDLKLLEMAGTVNTEKRGNLEFIRWSEEHRNLETQFNKIRDKLFSENVMKLEMENSPLIWNYPSEVFFTFTNVFVLTYMFKGQIQRAYFDLHSIRFRYLSVQKEGEIYKIVPYEKRKRLDKAKLRSLINVYDGKLNDVGNSRYAFSKTWYEKSGNNKTIITLKKNARNYLENICQVRSNAVMWTTIRGDIQKSNKRGKIECKVAPKGYSKQFLAMNSRATNEYREKFTMAYLVNRFMNPIERKFFEMHGVKIDEDAWALSELVQWIWRSRIRDGKSIDIYIPSKRMRELLLAFLKSDTFEEAPDNAIVNEYAGDWNI